MLLRLVEDADVVVEGFRPGVMDRLGVGYEALRERNPGIVFCSITGYGQTGPYTARSGHDMNYLGLIGMLDLTGPADGAPVQSAGQIADLGGGGLMAAYSILAALREAERTGRGQAVDVSMADGALSWLTMVAGQYLADGRVPGRGAESLTGGIVCYRPYACADGHVTLGALEPKFWAAWCAGVGRDDLMDKAFDPPGSDTHAEVERIFAERTRDEWAAFADQHDCCLEPVLDLGEALDSELVREREMVVEVDQPGAQAPVRPAGPPGQVLGHPGRRHPARPGAGRAHRAGAGGPGLHARAGGRAGVRGRGRRAAGGRHRQLPVMNRDGLLKMSELADASGVSAGTIKHYLREGLLGKGEDVVRTSRNMAYYPPGFVERIRLIKQLQEERFMPLQAIRRVLEDDPDRARALVELEDRILDRALAGDESRVSAAQLSKRLDIPREALDRMVEIGLLTPNSRGFSPRDVQVVEAIGRFRAGGYDEQIGFTVYDTLRYKRAMESLVSEEVEVVLERLAGELEPDAVVDLLEAGLEPLRDFIAALHSKLLIEELQRQRGSR